MATHTIAADEVGESFTLAAATVDTVTFDGRAAAQVEVITDGAAEVWYTLDGSTPTVGGNNCYFIPATPVMDVRNPPPGSDTELQLISAGTPAIRVQRGA